MATHLSVPRPAETGSCGCGCSSTSDEGSTGAAASRTNGPIREDQTVRDVLVAYPSAVSVLHTYGIDTCCGAGASLRDAAATAGADLEAILVSLQAQFGTGARPV